MINFVPMSPEDTPALTQEIIAHPAVRNVAVRVRSITQSFSPVDIFKFTGSDRVGRIIATECAKHLKPCVLELGGKSPAVVCFSHCEDDLFSPFCYRF